MGKIVNLKTTRSITEKFLESIKKPSPETVPEVSAVKTCSDLYRHLEVVFPKNQIFLQYQAISHHYRLLK